VKLLENGVLLSEFSLFLTNVVSHAGSGSSDLNKKYPFLNQAKNHFNFRFPRSGRHTTKSR